MNKGILNSDKQERAREMLRKISDKKPYYSTLEKGMLIKLWRTKRNYTWAEEDLIKQVFGRIRK